MRQVVSRGAVALGAVMVMVGCRSDLVEPGDVPDGVYVLESIGGRPLPVTLAGSLAFEVLADTLFIGQPAPESPGSKQVVRRSVVRIDGQVLRFSGARYWLAVGDGALNLWTICDDPAANCALLSTPIELVSGGLVLHKSLLYFDDDRGVYRLAR